MINMSQKTKGFVLAFIGVGVGGIGFYLMFFNYGAILITLIGIGLIFKGTSEVDDARAPELEKNNQETLSSFN